MPALLLVQIAERPQCDAPPSVYDAWPWQPLAALLLLVTFQLRSPAAAAAAVKCHVPGTHCIYIAEVKCVTAMRGLRDEGGGWVRGSDSSIKVRYACLAQLSIQPAHSREATCPCQYAAF